MMKSLFSIVLVLLLSASLHAQKLDLGNNLTVEIPEGYQQYKSDGYMYAAVDSTTRVMIAQINSDDFDVSKVLNKMDTLSYNLKNYELVGSETEHFYQWAKDYKKKYYKSTDDWKILTYTFYTNERPYCILFQYKNNDDLSRFESLVDSIKYNGSFWDKLVLTYRNAHIYWILLFCVVMIVSAILGKPCGHLATALLMTTAVAIILLLTIWGNWLIFAMGLAISFLWSLMTSWSTVSRILESTLDNIDD
ncbi:hypothetical protein AALN73_15980 [Bacteroides stercorirosoris]|mgnify:CR=1 FL=1|jgi:hypothetical protein|uniref:hypothetical protein n=1 Tax=Bacteroides stercorirosoris TaxID=871324 RepID=UPI0035115335